MMILTAIMLQVALSVSDPLDFDLSRYVQVDPVASSERHRLRTQREQRQDFKHSILRQPWRRCGVMGMPVCPKTGRRVVSAGF